MTAEPFWPGDRSPLYHPGSEKLVGTFTVPFLLSVNTESGTETPIIGIERCTGRDRGIGFATYVGGGLFVWASRGVSSRGALERFIAARLDAGLMVVTDVLVVVVVVCADIAGDTGIVVVVVDVVGEGMTTPDGGKETTPNDDVSVGPLGWLWGTKTTPKIPMMTNARETTHHIICGGRLSSCDFTSPNLV
jgi:hypothetical protein